MKIFPANLIEKITFVTILTAVWALLISVIFNILPLGPFVYYGVDYLFFFAVTFYPITIFLIKKYRAKPIFILAFVPIIAALNYELLAKISVPTSMYFLRAIHAQRGHLSEFFVCDWTGFFAAALAGILAIYVLIAIPVLTVPSLKTGAVK